MMQLPTSADVATPLPSQRVVGGASQMTPMQAAGMLTVEGDQIRTTPDGLLVVDTLLPAFFRPEHISDRYV